MRIIDKYHDYYDFLQSPDDTIVFDRRNSFYLTKEHFWKDLNPTRLSRSNDHGFVLMQAGATFWLILAKLPEGYDIIKNPKYELELLSTWKNYNKPREVLKITSIDFRYMSKFIPFNHDYWHEGIDGIDVTMTDGMQKEIDNNNYITYSTISKYIKTTSRNSHSYQWGTTTYTLPILNQCGLSQIIDATDLFCALEEHFSLEKSEKEKTEPLGATNNDKIIMHGFDTKTSFRGKNDDVER